MIIASSVKSAHNISELKEFLMNNNGKNVRIIARIETQEALNNYTQILDVCDGITFRRDTLEHFTYENKKVDDHLLIQLCKEYSKPCIVEINYDGIKADKKQDFAQIMDGYVNQCVDSFLLDEETSVGNDPLESINAIFEFLKKNPPEQVRSGDITPYYSKDESEIIDYIVANAYRITRELYVKAIICYTSNGYVATKLSSMKIDIPVIAFTKSDETFRYLTMLRGIKGYKISQGFNYENLKRIGKEMIRITFKGNISLDDKVLIIQANESAQDTERSDHTQSGMINGVEVYKFKEI
jgi:pyruvate kinase